MSRRHARAIASRAAKRSARAAAWRVLRTLRALRALRALRTVLLLLALAALPAVAAAQAGGGATAEEVKAAYIHKLAGYVEWPAGAFPHPESALVIGVLGADAVASELARIAVGRPMQGRTVLVRRLARVAPEHGAHIVFVARDTGGEAWRRLADDATRPVLIVAEAEGALERGAIVNFVMVDGRVRFEVDAAAAEQRGLKVSARLLAVAQRVVRPVP